MRGDNTTDTMPIKRTVKECYEELCGQKFNNLEEMAHFVDTICENSHKKKYSK